MATFNPLRPAQVLLVPNQTALMWPPAAHARPVAIAALVQAATGAPKLEQNHPKLMARRGKKAHPWMRPLPRPSPPPSVVVRTLSLCLCLLHLLHLHPS
jgi:hypothetical protein